MKPLKTALCFAGTCRSLQYTYQNIRDKLIDPLGECDIFVYVPENPHAHKAQELIALPQVKDAIIEPEPEYDLSNYAFRSGWPSRSDIDITVARQVYIKMLKSREKLSSMIESAEKKDDFTYDRVIFSRLDVFYFNIVKEIIEGVDLKKLYVSDFHNTYGGDINGINDRFAVSSSQNMSTYFNVLKYVDIFRNQTRMEMLSAWALAGISPHSGHLDHAGKLHAETLLKWHLDYVKVDICKIPVRFSRIAADDGRKIDAHLENGPILWNET